MSINIVIDASVADFLSTLGWVITSRDDHSGQCVVESENRTHPGLLVGRAERGEACYKDHVVVLTAKNQFRKCVKRTLVDGSRPRYQRKVHQWVQSSVFAIADRNRELEAAQAEVEAQKRRWKNAIRAVVGDKANIEAIDKLVSITFVEQDGKLIVQDVHSRFVYYPGVFSIPSGESAEENLRRVARVVEVLESERMFPSETSR